MAKKQKPAVSEEELNRRHQRFLALWMGAFNLANQLVWAGAIVGFAYVTFYLPVLVSHGESTTITIVQNWLANLNAHVWVAWAFGAGGAAYGYKERQARRKERAEKDARIQQLESRIDPNRTSSNLNQRGDVIAPATGDRPHAT